MEIETKFDINDEVWFIHPKSQLAVSGKILKIKIDVDSQKIYKSDNKRGLIFTGEYKEQLYTHTYYLSDKINKELIYKNDYQIFKTKDELISSLTNTN